MSHNNKAWTKWQYFAEDIFKCIFFNIILHHVSNFIEICSPKVQSTIIQLWFIHLNQLISCTPKHYLKNIFENWKQILSDDNTIPKSGNYSYADNWELQDTIVWVKLTFKLILQTIEGQYLYQEGNVYLLSPICNINKERMLCHMNVEVNKCTTSNLWHQLSEVKIILLALFPKTQLNQQSSRQRCYTATINSLRPDDDSH